ncbi:hypothetical protein DFH09DRAFT_1086079 [Mycena vulgaris]|nr:hypothetical protein DFH09DRAFT_1086079 [Mycena vulgaris]
MPHQPTAAQIRFSNILTALQGSMATFEVVACSLQAPFLEPISKTMQSLLTAVETHELLYAIIRLHINPETGPELSPMALYHLLSLILIDYSQRTLHKIHTFVEAQQEKSRIKQFFQQGEMSTLLKTCYLGLEEALEVFKVS